MRYNNYHKHDHAGNPWSLDVIVKPEEYCKRAVELGHDTVFTTNHGMQGNLFEWLEASKKYNLKLCSGAECYYVNDRFSEIDGKKDRSNKHIVIIAKNDSGVEQLNNLVTESHMTGFYYRPRIDKELLFKLDENDFIITTACVAGIWNEPELILALHRKFGKNFFLEVQAHNIDLQKEVNSYLLEIHSETGIPIIHANDSHYICPEDAKYRDIFLKGKGRYYENEEGMILDYPDYDEILRRYKEQGILSEYQAQEALENTLIFDDCKNVRIINSEIKLPSISENPSEDLRKILRNKWKQERESIPREKWKEYTDAIQYELNIVEKTHMENYFLIDYNVAKIGQEKYSGRLTNTGRGSAPSFYITKLLGLTDIDRIAAPITLFPTRFMSVERILGTRSLPDIDLNTTDREPFIRATEDLLGKENCAWMLSWKPLQDTSAFRVYCKGIGKDISEYDEIAKNLDKYRDDAKWKKIIEGSKHFVGVIESVSESPCSMLLYDKSVKNEIGLVRTSRGKMCCLLDGYNCDKYKYLKNDYLTVTVWAIIRDTCKLAGIKIPTINDMNKLLDEKTFKIYEKGLTCTINQADSEFATELVKRYKPKNVAEMSAFVAIIRPGCASLLNDFVDRKEYTTGVKELDEILVDGNHRMIYQELIMKYLIWLGIPETGSYDIIKKIAKKKFKDKELSELKNKLLSGWIEKVKTDKGFDETWKVVEQAAHYSFNASHSLSYAYDSLYGAYLKAHYPMEYFTTALNYYSGDEERTRRLIDELKSFGIELKSAKFRYSKSNYTLSQTDRSIYKGLSSIKFMNPVVADEIYSLRNKKYDTFMDLLYDLKKTTINSKQMNILIQLDFFEEFGDANKLLHIASLHDMFNNRTQVKKDRLDSLHIDYGLIRPFAEKETDKMFLKVNAEQFLLNLSKQNITYKRRTLHEKIEAQIEFLGYIDIADKRYNKMITIISVDAKYSPKLKVYSLKNGTTLECKVDKKTFNKNKISKGDIVMVTSQLKKPKVKRLQDGTYEPIPDTSEIWLTKYEKVNNL